MNVHALDYSADFVSISMGDYFAVTEKVKNEIQELKKSNIDFVPVKDQFGRTLYLLNPLTVIDNYDYIRHGKGDKDRHVMMPEKIVPLIKQKIEYVRKIHQKDLSDGWGE